MAREVDSFAGYIERGIGRAPEKLRAAAIAAALTAVFAFFGYKVAGYDFAKAFSSNVYNAGLPVEAVGFLKKNHIGGRIFNEYGWGGFLIWNLYPDNKVFIDSRGLNHSSIRDYNSIALAEGGSGEGLQKWEKLLQSYEADFILIPPLNKDGVLLPLVKALESNDRWALIHASYNSLLFARKTENNAALIEMFKRPDSEMLDVTIPLAIFKAQTLPANPRPLITLGDAYFKRGDYESARKAYELSLYRDPGNKRALDALKELRAAKGAK